MYHLQILWDITAAVWDTLCRMNSRPWWRHQMGTFSITGHLCGEFTDDRCIPRTKASDAELWCFLWSAPEKNGWVNNSEAGDLRRHRTHYDVSVVVLLRHPTWHGHVLNPIYCPLIGEGNPPVTKGAPLTQSAGDAEPWWFLLCHLEQAVDSTVDLPVIVRRAGLLWSQQDFEWRWSVPLFKCLTVLEFSFILFDLCLLITFFNFIMNYVPIVTFWIFTYHKIWILSIMFCFIWSYWIIYFLACLEVSWRVVS